MHTSSTTRLYAVASLLSIATAASPAFYDCLTTRSRELADIASCGHRGSLNHCLSTLPVDFNDQDLQTCFINAGCNADEATVEVPWLRYFCFGEGKELRRRQGKGQSATVSDDTETDSPPVRTSVAPARSTQAGAKTSAAAAPSTIADQTTAQQVTQATQTQPDLVTVTQEVTGGDVFTGVISAPLKCFDTLTKSTTICPLQTTGPSKGERLPCFPTVLELPTCAAGLICKTEAGGTTACMRAINTLDTAGTIVAIAFASLIALATGLIIFMCCRDRARDRKLRAKAEAAAIAAAGKAATTGPRARDVSAANSDRTPLMNQPGQDPFSDRQRAVS